MANTVATSPGTMASVAWGSNVWSNPNNAKASDNVYATSTKANGVNTTQYLKATNFGFTIPTSSTINGILVEIEKKASNNISTDFVQTSYLYLVKANSTTGTNKSSTTYWSTIESYDSNGSSSDLWGTTWTAAQINASDFGVAIAGYIKSGVSGVTASVDHIRITVYYTEVAINTTNFFQFF